MKFANFSSVILPSNNVYTFFSWYSNKLFIKSKLGILKLPINIPNVLHSFAFSIKLNRLYNNLLLKFLSNISPLNFCSDSLYDIKKISLITLEKRRDNSYNNFS